MPITIDIVDVIAIVGTISAIVFAIVTNHRANKQETEDKATSIAVLNSDIGYVKSGIDDIKTKQIATDTFMHELNNQIAKTDNSVKSAHHRLDMHEARLELLEHEQE